MSGPCEQGCPKPVGKLVSHYWNPLAEENAGHWEPLPGMEESAAFIVLNHNPVTGECTRLVRFEPGADTACRGNVSSPHASEVFVVSGHILDLAKGMWLDVGCYASRAPGEVQGPYYTDLGCVVLEISISERMKEQQCSLIKEQPSACVWR